MATLPLLGQNRAYYIPNLMGGNAGPAAGTPALGESGVLRDLIASLLANFNPSIGTQRIPMSMGGGGDSISDMMPGAAGAGGSETPVNPLEALGTLGTMANVAGAAGTIGSLLGIPDAGTLGRAVGTITNAGQAYYGDAAREQLERQINAQNEASGSLAGNADLGRYGYNPSLAAASQVASGMGTLAGVPIIGNALGQGLMMAADPVPSTPGDLVRAGVDTIVPGLINTVVKGLTGYTIGENIKGGMTPVNESIARTPEEVARLDAARAQNILDGMSLDGAPVETVVPTPVDQSMQSTTALGPDIAMEQEAMSGAVTPPEAPNAITSILNNISEFFGPTWAELTAGREAELAAPPPAPPVAEPPPAPTGFSTSPEVVNAIFDEMAQYQQMIESESSMGSGGSTEAATDYSGLSDFEANYT
jgi:hypothetical protein